MADAMTVEQWWWFGIQGDPMRQRHLYRDRGAATSAAEAHHAKTGDYVIVGFTRAGVETVGHRAKARVLGRRSVAAPRSSPTKTSEVSDA